MKRILLVLGITVLVAMTLLVGREFFLAQRADYGWDPPVVQPTFTTEHPRVLFDEAHYNASTAGFAGRYWPFARLLRADGYILQRGHGALTRDVLRGVRILVIANAAGAPKPQLFGINLPVSTDKERSDPAFTEAEVEVVRSWVEEGGSLLLIADHAPFGEAAAALGSAMGVTMNKGFVEVPGELSDPLLFSVDNGRLGDHPIITGNGSTPAVSRVMTYTGQSLDGPPDAAVLLGLPRGALEAVPAGGDTLVERPAGRGQGLAFEFRRGRVVVLGEGGMVTAQVSRRVAYGINSPDNDNMIFVLNVMKWLSRRL